MSDRNETGGRTSLTGPSWLCLIVFVAWTALLPAQGADPKSDFVQALARFSLALDGAFGDEGGRIRASLDSMERSLTAWDALVRTYESAMASELRSAEPARAARMHLALAGVYLDRNRSADALRELAAARRLAPDRGDVPMFEALAHSQLRQDPASATAAFRAASALSADDPISAYVLARQLFRVESTDEANQALQRFRDNESKRSSRTREAVPAPFTHLGLIQEIAGIEPFFPPVPYAEGFAELQRGDYTRAIATFRDAAAHDPIVSSGVEAGAMARAAAAFRDGSIEAARQDLSVALELAPESAEPHRLTGLVYLAARQFKDAIDALGTAVRLNPRDERARLALSEALVDSDQLPAARQALQDALALFPTSGRAHYKLGLIYQRQGLYPDAIRELTEAARLSPLLGRNSVYQTIGALARSQQDYDAAIAAFSQRVDLIPNDADAHQDLGEMYFRQGRDDEALAEFMVALMLNPARTNSFAAIGQVHLRNGRYAEAAAAARRAVTLDASHKEARYVLATSLVRLGNADEGKQELDVYQRLQTEATATRSRQLEIEGLRRDASVALASGEYEKSIALLRQVVTREPESGTSHMDLGIALLKAGHAAEAIEHFNAAVARSAHEDAHAYLADAYAALGRAADSQRERAIYDSLRRDALRRAGAGR